MAFAVPAAFARAPSLADQPDATPGAIQGTVASVLPAVVNITSWKTELQPTGPDDRGNAPRQRARVYGSGFVIDPTGIILTNNHVVDGGEEIIVGFSDGSRTPAKLMAAAREIDLALLRVDLPRPLPALRWGNSDKLRIGDTVLAIGNPLAIGTSVSAGIVSALNRDIQESPYDNLIQTDAAINHGNSGGPLVALDGTVVGVDTAIVSNQNNGGSIGLGFAIPAEDAAFVANMLRQYGRVRPGWLGLDLQDVTGDIALAEKLPTVSGAIIAGIDAIGPAAKADVHEGDVVLHYDGHSVTDARALRRDSARTELGQAATLGLWRDGREISVPITVAEWPYADERNGPGPGMVAKSVPDAPDFGLGLSPITDGMRQQYKLSDNQTGVAVSGVENGSPASDHGLVPGDVVLRIGDTPATSPDQVMTALHQASAQGQQYVMLLTRQRDGRRWITFRVGDQGR